MYTKEITYEDFNGVKRTEKLYFNLSKPELVKLQLSFDEGLDKYIMQIAKEKDPRKIIPFFEKLIDFSFGIKSEDGSRFLKSPQYTEEFKQTAAYDELYSQLIFDETGAEAIAFVKGIMPNMPELNDEAINKKVEELKKEL